MNQPIFKKGSVVFSGLHAVLVTGPGDKTLRYPTFAGVVIMSKDGKEEPKWPIGTFSRSWTARAFKPTSMRISEVINQALESLSDPGESAWESLRQDWDIKMQDIRDLGINPKKPMDDLTLRELGRLAVFLDVRIGDIVDY